MPDLIADQYTDFNREILVVDNNSQDGSADYLAKNYPQIKIIRNHENTGYVGANNIGYQYALKQGADFIYLLNQDTEITPGFLQPLYDFGTKNKFGSLQSKILLHPDTDKINTIGNRIHYLGFGYGEKSGLKDQHDQNIQKINYASGAGVFISMAALDRQGYLFDETLFAYLEDLDLGWSLQLLGYDNYLIPESVIYHKYEFNRSMRQIYWFERNRLWIMSKNYKLATLILIFPAFILMELGQLFFAFIHKRLGSKLKSYSWLFSIKQWQIFLAKRRYIQSRRVRPDRAAVKNFTGQILFQALDSFLLKLANIVFNLYWQLIKIFIFW